MKGSLATFLRSNRYLRAMAAGLLLAAAFPKLGISGLAWVAPGLLLASALGTKGWESFRIGYAGGLTYYLASLYWLLLIPYRWHGLPLGPALGWASLSAYCALYPAVWVWLLTAVGSPNSDSWTKRTLWAVFGAAAWVAWEMTIARLMSGFPWNLFGATQHEMLPLIQIASITGIYGVSFLLVWMALSLLCAALALIRRPTARSIWIGEILLPALATAMVFSMGLRHLKTERDPQRQLRVTLIQPSIPQTLIWDRGKDDERFRELIHLSEQALTNRTDLLIWPEAAVPKLLRYDQEVFAGVTRLARDHQVWIIVGADDAEKREGASDEADFYNSSFLINPEGKLVARYRKRSLVIFGEYIPLERWLPFLKWFTPISGGFTRGDRAVRFELTDLEATVSVLICFEDIFPHLAREYAEPDVDFLVNLTNNGWFGESSAQWQHAVSAVFRSVENGLPLVRCSNNGLTCWVDGRGRLLDIFHDATGRVYGPGFMVADIPLLNSNVVRQPTFYNRYGDVFGWICVAWTGAMMIGQALRAVRNRRQRG